MGEYKFYKKKRICVIYPDFFIKEIKHEKRDGKIFVKTTIGNNGGYGKNVTFCLYLNGKVFYKTNFNISYKEERTIEKYVEIRDKKK